MRRPHKAAGPYRRENLTAIRISAIEQQWIALSKRERRAICERFGAVIFAQSEREEKLVQFLRWMDSAVHTYRVEKPGHAKTRISGTDMTKIPAHGILGPGATPCGGFGSS
ncbi:hypothetical protein CHELA20_11682 [Hyphomicrobiales bacterium]|nr:hypothetical protein CHELA20_11682 [Hyphomicrobiales bacterium]CAH1689563.1 hypothetical protein CHELA41_50136 [Hyphomicrobiales bacterium]